MNNTTCSPNGVRENTWTLRPHQQRCVDLVVSAYDKYYDLIGDKVESLFFGVFMGTGQGKSKTMSTTFQKLKEKGYFKKCIIVSDKVILSDATGFEQDCKDLGFTVENYTRPYTPSEYMGSRQENRLEDVSSRRMINWSYKNLETLAPFTSDIILINKDKINVKKGKGYLEKILAQCNSEDILFVLDEGVYYKNDKNILVRTLRGLFKKSHKILSTATPVPNKTQSLVGLLSNLNILSFLFPDKKTMQDSKMMMAFELLKRDTIDWFGKNKQITVPEERFTRYLGETVTKQLELYNVYKKSAKVFSQQKNEGVLEYCYKVPKRKNIGVRAVKGRQGYKLKFTPVSYVDDIPKGYMRDFDEGFKTKENPLNELVARCATLMYVYAPVDVPMDIDNIFVETGISERKIDAYYRANAENPALRKHYRKVVNVGLDRVDEDVLNVFPEIGIKRIEAIYDIVQSTGNEKYLIYTWNSRFKELLEQALIDRGIKAFAYFKHKSQHESGAPEWKYMLEHTHDVMIVGYQEASKGINVHTFCTNLIKGEVTNNYENDVQSTGRIGNRIGQTKRGHLYNIFVKGATDYDEYLLLQKKHQIAMKFDKMFNYAYLI